MLRKCLVIVGIAIFISSTFFIENGAAAGKVKLLFWEMYGPSREFDKLTKEFNATHPDIEVVDVYFPGHVPLMQKVQIVATSESSERPDIIFYDCINTAATNELLPLVDLNKFLKKDPDIKYSDFYPVFQSFGIQGNKILSLHAWANCEILFYNKKLFKEAGLNRPPRNWSEMITYGTKLTKPGQWGLAFGFLSNTYFEELSWEWQSLVVSAGGKLWNKDYTAPLFNTPQGVEALQFLVDCIHKYKIMPLTNYPERGFENGQIAMKVDGTWNITDYTKALKEDLGFAIWPAKIKPAPNVGGEHFMIVQSNEEKERAAWEFVKYMLSAGPSIRVCELSGMVPTRRSIAESPKFQELVKSNPGIAVELQSMKYAIHRAPTPWYLKASEAIANAIQPALYNQISAQEAVSNAEKAVLKILETWKK